MAFDIRTIVMFSAFNSLFLFLLLLFFLLSGRGNQWYLKTFVLAKTLLTIGIILVAMRGKIPLSISLVVANILTFTGYNLELFSIISYDGVYRKKLLYTYIALAAISSILFLFVFDQPDFIRVGIMATFSFLPSIFAGVHFIIKKGGSRLLKFLGYGYVLTALVYLSRGLHAFAEGPDFQYMVQEDTFEVFFFIMINLSFFLGTVGFVMLLNDKAEEKIKIVNRELTNESMALRQANKVKNGFFSIISHDLRGPIGGLMSLSEMMLDDVKGKDEEMESMTEALYSGASETYRLLNDLLDWANSQRSMEEPEIKVYHLHELAENNLQLLEQQARAKNISLYNRTDESATVHADSRMTNTIIRNLMVNAIKFTPQGGKVTIFTKKSGGYYHLCVKDNGVGMDQYVIDKILNPAMRYTSAGTNNESGTGLGIQLCMELVAKQGGEFWIESSRSEGSEFWFSLPDAKED